MREEALGLLSNPEALWTVLTINGPLNTVDGFSRDPAEFMTPLAQFVRGICGTVRSQRTQADAIFEDLKKQLQERTVRVSDYTLTTPRHQLKLCIGITGPRIKRHIR